jgi:hypothetical protein
MHLTITDTLCDLVQNAVQASASLIVLDIIAGRERIDICCADNGSGMSSEKLAGVFNPLAKNDKHDRPFGLGLPFLKQAIEQCGGTVRMDSIEGEGTSVHISYDLRAVDAPPMGDLPRLVPGIMAFEGDYNCVCNYSGSHAQGSISRSELLAELGDLCSAASLSIIHSYAASLFSGADITKEIVYG